MIVAAQAAEQPAQRERPVRIEHQDHSARLLREGAVIGSGDHRAHAGARVPCAVTWCDAVRAGGRAGVCRAVSALRVLPQRWPRQRYRWRGIATTRCRICWCAECFVVRSRDLSSACPPPRDSGRPYAPGRAGACIPSGWQRRCWPTARSYGSPMRTSTYRCSGSAGSSTAQWSSASPRRSGRPLPKVVRAVAAVLETLSPDLHDDLSPCPPLFDVGQSFRDRFEWEGPINNGLYSTRIDEKT